MPTLSIIIPTKNALLTIDTLLNSIVKSTYIPFEIVIIDNFSTDNTPDFLQNTYLKKHNNMRFYQYGPERNAQRRYGRSVCTGDVLLFLDADMYLQPSLLEEIMDMYNDYDALIIGEIPFGADNYYTKCKCLERSFYRNDDATEACRAFKKDAYDSVNGFSDTMISLEDFDLTKRLRVTNAVVKRTNACLYHNEGYVKLSDIWRKKAYYGMKAVDYTDKHSVWSAIKHIYIFRKSVRNGLYKAFLEHPYYAMGVVILLTVQLLAGAYGYMKAHFTYK